MNMIKRLVSTALCLIMAAFSVPALAAWDGYEETAVGAVQKRKIVDADNLNTIIASGAAPESQIRHDAAYSIRWKDMQTNTRITFNDVPRDWTDYGRMEFWMYSAKALDTSIVCAISCDPETSGGVSERYFLVPLDYTGWKKFSINFNDMKVSRSAQLSKVNYMRFWSYGWGISEGNPEADVCLDSIYLARSSITDNYSEEAKRLKDELLTDSFAVYDGSTNVMVNGKISPDGLEAPAAADGGTVTVPASFFSRFLAAEQTDGKIKLGNFELTYTKGSNTYRINGLEKTFSAAPKEKNGILYLPLAECAAALGKTAAESGYLVVVGDEKVKGVADNREVAELIASEVAYVTIDVSALTPEDFDAVKDKWRERLVGSSTIDLSDEIVQNRVNAIESSAARYTGTLNRDPERVNLWGTAAPATSADMSTLYANVLQMAIGYTTKGCSMYGSEEAKSDILDCLSWLYDNVYGENIIHKNGFLNGSGGNWYDWRIGVPQYLVQILMLMEKDLTKEQIQKYLKPLDIKVPNPSGTGANKIDEGYAAIGSSLLQGDAKRLVTLRDSLEDTFQYVEYTQKNVNGEGFYTDGSYIFHTKHPMNGAYGVSMLSSYTDLVSILDGTVFEITSPLKENYTDWIYQTYTPLMWDGNMMSMVRGRTIRMSGAAERSAGRDVIIAMLQMIPYQRPEHQEKMKSIVKYHVSDSAREFYQYIPVSLIAPLKEIMEDDTILPYEYDDTKIYHKMDRVVHHQDKQNYAFGLAMSSSRIYNYESITGYNTTGWYIGDGMTYVYTDSDPRQYERDYWQNVNPYRMPGTTVDTQEREAASIAQTNEYLSHQDFVGGVSIGGNGVAAMSLESYHCDGSWGTNDYYYYPSTNTYNAPIHDSSLVAKKSWFMFDDEIVALGADINSENGINVETIVDNRKSFATKIMNKGASSIEFAPIETVASVTPEVDNPAANATDGDMNTRWAAEGSASLTMDLGESQEIGYVTIAFYNGAKRQTTFDIQISDNGTSWTTVFSGKSGGKTDGFEAFELGAVSGRYVKYIGYESTGSTWVSVNEMKVYSPSPTAEFSLGNAESIGMEQVQSDEGNWSMGYDTRTRDVQFVSLEGFGGYYFPDRTTVYARKTNTNPSFFELWLDHGVDPKGASYAYAILPGKTVAELQEYSKDPDFLVLENNASIQAVREKNTGTVGIVFWEKGEFGSYKASVPMIVMAKEEEENVTVSVSDPTWKLTEGTLDLGRKNLKLTGSCEGVTFADGVITFNFEGACGKTLELHFEKEKVCGIKK